MDLPATLTVSRKLMQFILNCRGPPNVRNEIFRLLLTMDVDAKVSQWTVLSFVVRYGGDDDLELVEEILRYSPRCGAYQFRGGISLLGQVYRGRWKYNRRALIYALAQHGERDLVGVWGNFHRSETFFLLRLQIVPSSQWLNSHHYSRKTKIRTMGFLYSHNLIDRMPDKFPTEMKYNLGMRVEPKTVEDVRIHLKRSILVCDQFGFKLDCSFQGFQFTVDKFKRIFDMQISPIMENFNNERLNNEYYVYVLRRFPRVLTTQTVVNDILCRRNIELIAEMISIAEKVPNIEMCTPDLGYFVYRCDKLRRNSNMELFEQVVRRLAAMIPENEREDVFRSVKGDAMWYQICTTQTYQETKRILLEMGFPEQKET